MKVDPIGPIDLQQSAASQGFSMPAQWAPLESVWLARPRNEETWPGCLEAAQAEWDAWRASMETVARVRTTDELGIATSAWIREFGLVFVKNKAGQVAAHSFVFNGWGGKRQVSSLDNAVSDALQKDLGIPMWRHQCVLQGSSIDSNGAGTLLTTRQCLENKNRNSESGAADIEQVLRDALGITNIIWLPGGIEGDVTDCHVDNVTHLFVATQLRLCGPPRITLITPSLRRIGKCCRRRATSNGKSLNCSSCPRQNLCTMNFHRIDLVQAVDEYCRRATPILFSPTE